MRLQAGTVAEQAPPQAFGTTRPYKALRPAVSSHRRFRAQIALATEVQLVARVHLLLRARHQLYLRPANHPTPQTATRVVRPILRLHYVCFESESRCTVRRIYFWSEHKLRRRRRLRRGSGLLGTGSMSREGHAIPISCWSSMKITCVLASCGPYSGISSYCTSLKQSQDNNPKRPACKIPSVYSTDHGPSLMRVRGQAGIEGSEARDATRRAPHWPASCTP